MRLNRTLATVLLLGVAVTLGACAKATEHKVTDEEEDADRDDATGRRDALLRWYDESGASEHQTGGAFSAEYRRYLLEEAGRERGRWGDLLSDVNVNPGAAVGYMWKNLGPTKADEIQNGNSILKVSDSGRARSIVIAPTNPNLIYLATAAGGVWKSVDGGAHWDAITESLGTLSTGSLAMDPSDSKALFLGLGDPFDGTGAGVTRSLDGGATWSAPVFLGDSTATPQVMVAKGDKNVVLAATNAGLYRSTDRGVTWSAVTMATGSPEGVKPYAWSIASTGDKSFAISLEANKPNLMGTTDGQVWFTTDLGETWTKAAGMTKSTNVGRITLASAPSKPSVVYAMAAVPNPKSGRDLADLFKSTDGGATWTALEVTAKSYTNSASVVGGLLNGQGWYDQLVLVNPKDENVFYVGGALLAARTTDGGKTFTQVSEWLGRGLPYVHADFHAGAFDSTGALYLGSDGGIFRSKDDGKTFTADLNIGITSHLFYSVSSSHKNPNAVLGGLQDNGTRMRVGASSTFNQVIGGDGFGSDIHESLPDQMLGTLYFDQIVRSTDGGKSWDDACTGLTECGDAANAPFITRIVRWSGIKEGVPEGNIVYTFSNKVVYRSEDYAASWQKLAMGGLPADVFIRNVGVAPGTEQTVGVVANGGRVFLSADGGATFTLTAPLPNNDKSLSYITFDRADAKVVYVTSVAPKKEVTHAWKSTDFGATWSAIDTGGLPRSVPVNVIKADPGDGQTLYAGTHLGVYRSRDGGTTWARFGWGMPLVNVTDLYVSPDSKIVRVATFGRGLFELTPWRPRDPN